MGSICWPKQEGGKWGGGVPGGMRKEPRHMSHRSLNNNHRMVMAKMEVRQRRTKGRLARYALYGQQQKGDCNH